MFGRFASLMVLVYISFCLLILYSILIFFYHAGWREIKPFLRTRLLYTPKISVVIAARNEEKNIGNLLASLQSQTYPFDRFEVIVVNDHSTDNTEAIVRSFSFARLIKLQSGTLNSYKKKAIETGIGVATGDLIVTTDADCLVNEGWLETIAGFKQETNAVFIAAPVVMQCDSGLLQVFQSLDFLTLQGITGAAVQKKAHNMCNGANLAYEKKTFLEVNGFEDIDHIASGDDMLLMQKIARQYPDQMAYLMSKDAIVTTEPARTWKEFFNQRIRWASKATNYNDIKIFSVLFLVYFFNCLLLALFIAGFWNHLLWLGLAGLLVAKIIVELIFIYPVAKFYDKENLLPIFPLLQPIHIVYTVIAGWFGVFGSFEWKGRRVK